LISGLSEVGSEERLKILGLTKTLETRRVERAFNRSFQNSQRI